MYHTKNGVNAFFVDKQYFPLFGIRDNSPEKLFNPLSDEFSFLKEQWGPGKELIPEDNEYLIRKEFKIKKKFIFNR